VKEVSQSQFNFIAAITEGPIILIEDIQMKQQCHISFVYGSWLILFCGFLFFLIRGNILQAVLWACFVAFFLWLYMRYFPSLSRSMGYGSVADQPATDIKPSNSKVFLYTGLGCPFCPLVKRRLNELQSRMGFDLNEMDVTLKPDLLLAKGIRALPVVEVGGARWVGNATSQQLASFISSNTSAGALPGGRP
jgi:glutaredoxin